MTHLDKNREAWNVQARGGGLWSRPVDAATIAAARAGEWEVKLTSRLPVPRSWFGELAGRDVLCLASAGGQQAPVLAAAGARVTSFDLSDEQLARDAAVAEREGLSITLERGDMADLSRFADASFDLVFHPVSNVFVPDVRPVWRECFRVLRSGGRLLSGAMNPALFLFDHEEADRTERLVVKHALPYSDAKDLPADEVAARLARGEPLEYSHSLDSLIGAQLAAGFRLVGFYEDRWSDPSWFFSRHHPTSMAMRAEKP